MIFGHGVDIVDTRRFEKWVRDGSLIQRYFNKEEMSSVPEELTERRISALCQHYAVRFAAKEAFSKALGTGISGFDLRDLYIRNDERGKPYIVMEGTAEKIFKEIVGKGTVHVSLSHEKEYGIASVIIEITP